MHCFLVIINLFYILHFSFVGRLPRNGTLNTLLSESFQSSFLEVFKAFKVVLESIQHFGYGVPLSNVYSVYITSTRELKYIADDLMVIFSNHNYLFLLSTNLYHSYFPPLAKNEYSNLN